MNFDKLLAIAENVWTALKSEKSKEDAMQILGVTDTLKEKIVQIFQIAEDAADDVTAIATIAMSALERITDDALTRAIAKPLSDVESAEDVTVIVLQQFRSLQQDLPV